jgi:murein DD-endopeptidase MepM/ murein hydrolase activator NlpD
MKKHSLAEFLKSKSFYALLCIGALAIIVITMISLNQSSNKDDNNNLVDLNEPIVSDVADGDQEINTPSKDNDTSSTAANNKEGTGQTEVANANPNEGEKEPVTDGSYLEYYEYPENAAKEGTTPSDTTKDQAANETVTTQNKETTKADNAADETASTEKVEETKEVMTPDSLNFDADKGLLWPVSGNVIMNYSVDRVIYHETLEQFRCNPAVIIDAKIGSEVKSTTKGIITSITHEDETGVTVTAAIGSGYSVVYGQLAEDVKVKVGDVVKEGQVIGTIAKPTKYYTVEGSNLYFQVVKDDETVNPMLLLR